MPIQPVSVFGHHVCLLVAFFLFTNFINSLHTAHLSCMLSVYLLQHIFMTSYWLHLFYLSWLCTYPVCVFSILHIHLSFCLFCILFIYPLQGIPILWLESRDQDQYNLIVSLVVDTKTETLLSSVSISSRDLDSFCLSLEIETETQHFFNLHIWIRYILQTAPLVI
jgi:hypothetical protein